MNSQKDDLRVIVLAPTGRDGSLICHLLSSKNISCVHAVSAAAAALEVNTGAGALILAEEALTSQGIELLARQIAIQPSWSDFPIIVLTMAGEVDAESQRRALLRQPLGNMILVERPARPETLVSTVLAALRSRRRQYQVRDYLAERLLVEAALRQSEKLAVVGRLSASIAHEINNPLASVTNLLYLMGRSSSLDETQAYTLAASNELARVSEIVTQTLSIYRQNSKPSLVQIPEIVNSALALYKARLSSAKIVIERDFRECPPVLALAGELRQLILNLVGNAFDAMWNGGTLKIRVAPSRERSNGSRPGIRLTIADTGVGIQPEIKEHLFEPFVSTKGNTGTGLGLWVSSGIVQKHSGKIQVRSNSSILAAGTVFSVFLPEQPHFAHIQRAIASAG